MEEIKADVFREDSHTPMMQFSRTVVDLWDSRPKEVSLFLLAIGTYSKQY